MWMGMGLERGEQTLGDVEGGEEDCFEHSIEFMGIPFTCLAGSVIIDVVVSHHAHGCEVGLEKDKKPVNIII